MTPSKKSKLMQSASMALFVLAPLSAAHAQSVTVTDTVAITADASKSTDQKNTNNVTGTSTSAGTTLSAGDSTYYCTFAFLTICSW